MSELGAEPAPIVEAAFQAAEAVLAAAARSGRASERFLTVAGICVRIRFAGPPSLAHCLDRAFGHLASAAPRGQDLEVLMIDGQLAEAAPLAKSPLFASAAETRMRCYDYGDGALTLRDYARGRCLQWIHDVSAIPPWAAASPLRAILGGLLATRGRYLAHGAAIGCAFGAVLVAAKGGSGKSTTALACLDAPARAGVPPLTIAGDDFVVLEPDAKSPRVHSLLGTAKVGRDHAKLFPGLERLITRDGGPLDVPGEKAVLSLIPGAADRLALVLPLAAIAVPSLGLDWPETRLVPISKADALRALAPSSIFLVRAEGAAVFGVLAGLVAGLPVYGLRIGSDVRGIPTAIEALLADALARRAAEGTPAEAARG